MELRILGNVELDGAICDHISNEVNRLRRRLPGITMARIDLFDVNTIDRNRGVLAQVTLSINPNPPKDGLGDSP